uniref:Bm14439 n=1 Tax=Brugia malayi TaxID=6279 RepID=A0A0J9Y5Q7_BRUMA|nr:Bm14439 [Brugia malayi]
MRISSLSIANTLSAMINDKRIYRKSFQSSSTAEFESTNQ